MPRGSCEEVIHSVVTMRKNSELTRVTCAGVIDADDFGSSDAAFLSERGIAILPVSEIENLVLLSDVSRAIAESEGYSGKELNDCIEKLRSEIFSSINAGGIEDVVVRHCKRRMDRYLKRIEFGDTGTVEQLEVITKTQLEGLNVRSIADAARSRINKAVTHKDLELLLACYDNKGFLALASTHLKRTRENDFESWLTRVLRSKKAPSVVKAIQNRLPSITAR